MCGITNIIARLAPAFLRERLLLLKELDHLQALEPRPCKTDRLRPKSDFNLAGILQSPYIEAAWNDSQAVLNQFNLPNGALGVNPGDRRAIFYLVRALRPTSVLEIGTHIGASMIHIAAALNNGKTGNAHLPKLTTVDIADVNSPAEGSWVKYRATDSPIAMISKLGCAPMVEFVTDTSLNYAARCEHKFDFIFLDGDHWGPTVYQEIPAVLDLLNPNGVILLHDYFPDMQPLWCDGSRIAGPFLATERLRREGAGLTVEPLGELPWPTKLNSNVTSLAVVLRDN